MVPSASFICLLSYVYQHRVTDILLLWVLTLYCHYFVAHVVPAVVIRRSFRLASACSGHRPVVSGVLPCFLAKDAPGHLVFSLLQS